MNNGYHFLDMHMLWWLFWIVFIAIMFCAFEPVRRRRAARKVDVVIANWHHAWKPRTG